MTNEEIKRATLDLYHQLPQDEEGRKARIDIRDKVIELNYALFGYIAAHKYIHNPYASYEDKLQSVVMHFCEIWYKYQWEGHYRTDLSFGVFFRPRITEMMEREFEDVKYSIRRSLCIEVGNQLGKHWAKVTYDDLMDPKVKLAPDKMDSLKAIFGAGYPADVEDCMPYLTAEDATISYVENLKDDYDSIEDLLIREMIDRESKLSPSDINQICDIYALSIAQVKEAIPGAEKQLYKKLKEAVDLQESY